MLENTNMNLKKLKYNFRKYKYEFDHFSRVTLVQRTGADFILNVEVFCMFQKLNIS